MSAVAEPIQHILHDDKLARRNAIVLAVAQALAGGNNTVIVSTASIIGAVLAPDKGLATLPVTAMVFGMWLGTLPLGVLARHFGRRFALQSGSVFGILSGLISYAAVMNGSFWLLLVGTFCGGLYAAAHQSYRFAAADTASDAYRPKVVSWVFGRGRLCGRTGTAACHLHKGSAVSASFRSELSRPVGVCIGGGHCAAVRQGAAARTGAS
jgi:MFS family permease